MTGNFVLFYYAQHPTMTIISQGFQTQTTSVIMCIVITDSWNELILSPPMLPKKLVVLKGFVPWRKDKTEHSRPKWVKQWSSHLEHRQWFSICESPQIWYTNLQTKSLVDNLPSSIKPLCDESDLIRGRLSRSIFRNYFSYVTKEKTFLYRHPG